MVTQKQSADIQLFYVFPIFPKQNFTTFYKPIKVKLPTKNAFKQTNVKAFLFVTSRL